MPVKDWKLYPPNWKTEIRPAILERDGHKCKKCRVANYQLAFRGILDGQEVFQLADGNVYAYPSGEFVIEDFYAAIEPISGDPTQKAIKIVLTVAHLDGDVSNNAFENLASLCQKCHLRLDKIQHIKNARATIEAKKGLQRLF